MSDRSHRADADRPAPSDRQPDEPTPATEQAGTGRTDEPDRAARDRAEPAGTAEDTNVPEPTAAEAADGAGIVDASNHDASNHDASNHDASNHDAANHDAANHDAANHDAATDDSPATDAAVTDSAATGGAATGGMESGGVAGGAPGSGRGSAARPTRRRSTRGQLVLAVVLCTLGAGLALYAASKNWVVQTGEPMGPLQPPQTGRTGTEITPVVPTLALISLAGAGALVATRRIGRLLIGVLLVLTGLGVAVGAGYGLYTAAHDAGSLTWGWPVLALVGGLLVTVVGVLTVRRGRAWPTMGSRYERPAGRAASVGVDDDAAKIWDAIDDGQDPTVR